jgi:hypothetical protein
MREEGRALLKYLEENFPGASHYNVSLRGSWDNRDQDLYRWEVFIHFPGSQKDLQVSESDLEVLKIKLEAEVASRKVLARLTEKGV